MNKILLKGLVPTLAIVLLGMFGCKEGEEIVKVCSGDDYTIISLEVFAYGKMSINAPDKASVFPEDIIVTVKMAYGPEVITQIKANDPSPKVLVEYQAGANGHQGVKIEVASCPNPIEKTEEDITNDTKALCSGQVEIVATTCENIVKLNWQSDKSLTGVTLNVYGKTIDLGSATSATFDKASLDLNKADASLSNANGLCLLFATTACTGNTGTLSVSPTIEAGQNLAITVTDADLNIAATTAETVTVTVTTSKNESENVILTETGVNTGIFTGTLATVLGKAAGTNNDASLVIENGTTITTTYDDQLDSNLSDPAPISKTVTAAGASAPAGTAVIYNGQTFYLTDHSYQPLEFESPFSTWFTLMNADNTFDIELMVSYTTNSLTSGTYTVGGSENIVVVESSGVTVGTDGNQFKEFTSGTVVVTVGQSSYTLLMNLQTSVGTLTGTYVVPF